jgi:hypothetical protein
MVMKKSFLLSIMAFAISVTSCTNDSQDELVSNGTAFQNELQKM